MCMHIFYEVTMLTHVDLYDIICSGNKFKMIFFFFENHGQNKSASKPAEFWSLYLVWTRSESLGRSTLTCRRLNQSNSTLHQPPFHWALQPLEGQPLLWLFPVRGVHEKWCCTSTTQFNTVSHKVISSHICIYTEAWLSWSLYTFAPTTRRSHNHTAPFSKLNRVCSNFQSKKKKKKLH